MYFFQSKTEKMECVKDLLHGGAKRGTPVAARPPDSSVLLGRGQRGARHSEAVAGGAALPRQTKRINSC